MDSGQARRRPPLHNSASLDAVCRAAVLDLRSLIHQSAQPDSFYGIQGNEPMIIQIISQTDSIHWPTNGFPNRLKLHGILLHQDGHRRIELITTQQGIVDGDFCNGAAEEFFCAMIVAADHFLRTVIPTISSHPKAVTRAVVSPQTASSNSSPTS